MAKQYQLQLVGMSCAGCARAIERALTAVPGVDNVHVNFANEVAAVDANNVTPEQLVAAVQAAGYNATIIDHHQPSDEVDPRLRAQRSQFYKFLAAAILSTPLLYTMFAHFSWTQGIYMPHWLMNPWVQLVLATPVQFVIGWQFYRGSVTALRQGAANMDVLVALGTSAAYFYSLYLTLFASPEIIQQGLYFETSAVLITLILLGKWFEARAKGRSSAAIQQLLQLQPKTALRERPDAEPELVDVAQLQLGDIIHIKPGQQIPTDCVILSGESAVDEAMLTGESIPVDKHPGDLLIGATLNQHGFLRAQVQKLGRDTALAQIIHIVEQAQNSKAPIQRLADKVAAIFVPAVLVIAAITFVIWFWWIDAGNYRNALEATVAVLVIACPCALGLATPTSIMAGSGRAAQWGILFKQSEGLELTHQVTTIVFDKTGTLTQGQPRLTDITITPPAGLTDSQVQGVIKALEQQSEHPLAQAIVHGISASADGIHMAQFKAHAGMGISAVIEGLTAAPLRFYIGNLRLMQHHGVVADAWLAAKEELEQQGKTTMLIGCNDHVIGLVAVADTLRPHATTALAQLRQRGLKLVMLTGDNPRTAHAIAQQVGIDTVIAEVLPEHKADHIRQLRDQGEIVAMVGDGINDAPALATAHIGIALGSGTDIALETADIALLRPDLRRLVDALHISENTVANIRQNLFWAFAYNVLGIPIAASGLLAPWLAGGAMALSSVSVVLNALRLQRLQPPTQQYHEHSTERRNSSYGRS